MCPPAMTPLRPLRPRPMTDGDNEPPKQDVVQPPVRARQPSRQRKTNSACDPCRKRKIKCDGRLPKCRICEHRGDSCAYTYSIRHTVTVTEGENASHSSSTDKELLDSIRTLPEDQALELLKKIRHTSESSPISSSNPLEQTLAQNSQPPSQSNLESEFALQHPQAYPELSPSLLPSMSPTAVLNAATTPQLLPPRQEGSPDRPAHEDSSNADVGVPPDTSREAIEYDSLFDNRLRTIEVSHWTPVLIPNDLAARCISHYLEVDHAVFPLFDTNLFINDLIEVKPYFCSTFLVNALLCWASKSYTPLDADASNWTLPLFDQAQKDAADLSLPNTLTTMAALQLLNMTASAYNKHDLSFQLTQESLTLGRLMGLFNVRTEEESARSWLEDHNDWIRAASYTSWGVFNWVSLVTSGAGSEFALPLFHVHLLTVTERNRLLSLQRPTLQIEVPPLLPRPRDFVPEPTRNDTELAKAACYAYVFSASRDMWLSLKNVIQKHYESDSTALVQHISHDFVEEIYSRLLSWTDQLETEVILEEESIQDAAAIHEPASTSSQSSQSSLALSVPSSPFPSVSSDADHSSVPLSNLRRSATPR
nr:C6 transcription factor [Colletotrichum truncatum]KAF6798287.1 C6 transcription factor [Colletotrichum truncatum]